MRPAAGSTHHGHLPCSRRRRWSQCSLEGETIQPVAGLTHCVFSSSSHCRCHSQCGLEGKMMLSSPMAFTLLLPPEPIQPLCWQATSLPLNEGPWPWLQLCRQFPLQPGKVPAIPMELGGGHRGPNLPSVCGTDPGEARAEGGVFPPHWPFLPTGQFHHCEANVNR